MTEGCANKTCDKHEETMIDVKSYKLVVLVFGTLASLLLIALVTMTWTTKQEIAHHKLVALDRYSNVEKQMVGVNGSLNAMNIHIVNVKEDTQELKVSMKEDTAEIKELINSMKSSVVVEAEQLDTSMISVNNL